MKQLHLNYRNYYYFSNTSIRNTCKEVKDYKFVKAGRALKRKRETQTLTQAQQTHQNMFTIQKKIIKVQTLRMTIE